MRTANRVAKTNFRKIRTMNDLKLEKARLKTEIVRSEEKVKSSFKRIIDAFALRNIFNTLTTEFSSSSLLAKGITLGRDWLSRRKKKKKQKREAAASHHHPSDENNENI